MIKLFQENTLTGEVFWVGKSTLAYHTYTCFNGVRNYEAVVPELKDEKYAYVIMKVKVDDN